MKYERPDWANLDPVSDPEKLIVDAKAPTIADTLRNMSILLAGRRAPYSCSGCNADFTMWEDNDHPGLFRGTVFHDDDCPVLAKKGKK